MLNGLGLSYRENERLLGELHVENVTDALTGLGNRRSLLLDLDRALSGPPRSSPGFVFGLFDLDGFKAYNDAFGHPAGDRLLKAVTASWQEELRPGDVLARYGGEEFAVMLPGCDAEQATAVLERLRRAMPLAQTCSAGSATACPEEAAEALLARADAALYLAKRAGRDRVVAAA